MTLSLICMWIDLATDMATLSVVNKYIVGGGRTQLHLIERSKGWTFASLDEGYLNYARWHVAYLFNRVIHCIPGYDVIFVQVDANAFIGKLIMNILKWEIRRTVCCPTEN